MNVAGNLQFLEYMCEYVLRNTLDRHHICSYIWHNTNSMLHSQTFAYVYIFCICWIITVIWTDSTVITMAILGCIHLQLANQIQKMCLWIRLPYESSHSTWCTSVFKTINNAHLETFHPDLVTRHLGMSRKKWVFFLLKGMSPENALIHFSVFLE